jgi:lactate dehydrogenase-like 2-hydroxyacid dehydrogenase
MKTKPKVVADQPGAIVEEARTLLESVASIKVPRSYDLPELRSLLNDAKGVFSWGNVKLVDALLTEASQLRVIGVVGVGCDHVDLGSATRNGIVVANGPGSNAEAVAEFALLLILALARHLIPAQADCMKQGLARSSQV